MIAVTSPNSLNKDAIKAICVIALACVLGGAFCFDLLGMHSANDFVQNSALAMRTLAALVIAVGVVGSIYSVFRKSELSELLRFLLVASLGIAINSQNAFTLLGLGLVMAVVIAERYLGAKETSS